MDDFEIEKYVDYAYETPFGGILHLKGGAAIIIRGNGAEILASLEEYHTKYKDDSSTWNELTNDQDKGKLYAANAAALTKIKWMDVETVVEAARKIEAAENRKSLIDIFVGRDGLINAIASFPLVIFTIWGISFGLKRYFGVELSHLQNGAVAGIAAGCMYGCLPKKLGLVTFLMAAFGYLLIAIVIWMDG